MLSAQGVIANRGKFTGTDERGCGDVIIVLYIDNWTHHY